MADKPPAKADPIKELKWFGGFLLVVIVLWVVGGGPKDLMIREGVFLKPPAPLNSGETYGGTPFTISNDSPTQGRAASPLYDLVQISRGSSLGAAASDEYVLIKAPVSNTYGINISGFRLVGTPDGPDITLGDGDKIQFGRTVERGADIILLPGESAYVVTMKDANVSLPGMGETFWASYLNKTERAWGNSGGLLLLDKDGKIVSAASY